MIKANVGLSRKLTRDFNSSGYSVNLEGEVAGDLDDHQAVLERIEQLYAVAEAALLRRISLDQADMVSEGRVGGGDGQGDKASDHPANRREPNRGTFDRGTVPIGTRAATPKQIAFVRTLARRQRITPVELESVIFDALGRRTDIDRLTKAEAATLIDALNQSKSGNGSPAR